MSARRDAQPVDLGHPQNSDNMRGPTRKSTESDSEGKICTIDERSSSSVFEPYEIYVTLRYADSK